MTVLLQSRKFVIAVLVIAWSIFIAVAPDDVSARLQKYVDPVAGVLITIAIGTTLETSVKYWSERPNSVGDAIRDAVDEIIKAATPAPLIPPPTTTTTTVNVTSPSPSGITEGVG